MSISIIKKYNQKIYEIYNVLRINNKPMDGNNLWKIFEYYSCIMLSQKYNKPFYMFEDIDSAARLKLEFTKKDIGIDACNLIDTIVQCKLIESVLTWKHFSTFFANQNAYDESTDETIVRWKKMIIVRRSDSKLSKYLAKKSKLFIDIKYDINDVITYCKKLMTDGTIIKQSINQINNTILQQPSKKNNCYDKNMIKIYNTIKNIDDVTLNNILNETYNKNDITFKNIHTLCTTILKITLPVAKKFRNIIFDISQLKKHFALCELIKKNKKIDCTLTLNNNYMDQILLCHKYESILKIDTLCVDQKINKLKNVTMDSYYHKTIFKNKDKYAETKHKTTHRKLFQLLIRSYKHLCGDIIKSTSYQKKINGINTKIITYNLIIPIIIEHMDLFKYRSNNFKNVIPHFVQLHKNETEFGDESDSESEP
jgi:hypothetical protein